MYTTVNSVVPQTNDLREDVKTLQKMLDKKMGLYGDALMQNGLEWKAMGLPVDDQLLNATKSWLLNLCNDVLMALDNECKKVQGMVTDMADLVNKPFGDSVSMRLPLYYTIIIYTYY
jgi:hypothetical protein